MRLILLSSHVVLLGILSGALGASAQSPAQGQIQVMQTEAGKPASGETAATVRTLSQDEIHRLASAAQALAVRCPIALQAKQSGVAYNRQVTDGPSFKGIDGKDAGQRINLSVAARDDRRVVAASVTVHGYANKGRIVQTLAADDNGDAVRTVDVRFSGQAAGETSAELALPGFSGVTSVQLKSITYSDGSTWMLADAGACSVRVDPMMLVSGR